MSDGKAPIIRPPQFDWREEPRHVIETLWIDRRLYLSQQDLIRFLENEKISSYRPLIEALKQLRGR